MKARLKPYILFSLITILCPVSCSTTRVLAEGEYRLAKNSVEVTNSDQFNVSSLHQYIKQSPNSYFVFGWNPFLNVYNFASPENDGLLARFWRRIGVPPVVYNPAAVESTMESMENHLEYMGYYNSKVSSEIHVKKRKVNVDYNVTLGRRYRIDSLSFVLPQRGTFKQDFLADRPNLTIKVGDYLSEEQLEAETQRGASHFRDLGYYTFTKNHYVFEADSISEPGRLLLEMRINEYSRNDNEDNTLPISRFYIDNVTISHAAELKIKERTVKDLNTIRPGELYSESNVNRTYARLSALRMFNSVGIGMTQTDTNKVSCAISLSESRLQGFKANLEASSNSSGLMGLSPQFNFYHKNIFHGGEWLNLGFMGNFQFKFNDPTRSNEFGVSAGISLPKFLGLHNRLFSGTSIPRTEINFSYNYQNRPEYTRNTISLSFGYTGTLANRVQYQIYPVETSIVRLSGMDEEFYNTLSRNPFMRYAYQDHFDQGVGGTVYYSTNMELSPSVSYRYIRFTTDISGNFLSLFNGLMSTDAEGCKLIWGTPYSQYIRGELTLGSTWRFGRNDGQALAARLLGGLGYAYGNSSALPFEKQFYSGGANSMRGWQARALGPGSDELNSTFIIPSQTGDLKLEANLEYRFDLFWKLAGALFIDAGNIWTLQGDDADGKTGESIFDSIALDWGTGARVDLNFLILRLDLGMKLLEPSRENKWLKPNEWLKRDGFAVHFGVGYPF